jgi:hypothetical protein
MMEEYFFQCPHCWEEISMLIDTSVDAQNYIEDCEVCCNPIQLNIQIEEGEIISFNAEGIDQ